MSDCHYLVVQETSEKNEPKVIIPLRKGKRKNKLTPNIIKKLKKGFHCNVLEVDKYPETKSCVMRVHEKIMGMSFNCALIYIIGHLFDIGMNDEFTGCIYLNGIEVVELFIHNATCVLVIKNQVRLDHFRVLSKLVATGDW